MEIRSSKLIMRWAAMMSRCYNPINKSYPGYGGRGIKVCDHWHDFRNFAKDIGEIPKGLSLDRINNDGDYEPNNIRFANWRTQANNRRSTLFFTYKGETKTIREWSDIAGLSYATLASRIRKGWDMENVLKQRLQDKTGAHEISKATGIPQNTLSHRISRGYSGEDLWKENLVTRKFEFQGKTKTLTEWSQELGISRKALERRIYRGTPVEEAFSKPQKFFRSKSDKNV